MSITIEEREQIEHLDLKKHVHLVDGYIASGMDMDDLTIHYAVDQERILLVLRGYGFYPDPWSNVQFDSRKKYKGLPYQYVEEFITAFYPGIIASEADARPKTIIETETAKEIEIEIEIAIEAEPVTLEGFLDKNHPGWRNSQHRSGSSLFHLSDEELQGKSYYDKPSKSTRTGRGLLKFLQKGK